MGIEGSEQEPRARERSEGAPLVAVEPIQRIARKRTLDRGERGLEARVVRWIAAGASTQVLLRLVCRTLSHAAGGLPCAAGVFGPTGRLEVFTGAGLDPAYFAAVVRDQIAPENLAALAAGRSYVVTDFSHLGRTPQVHAAAQRDGLALAYAMPVLGRGPYAGRLLGLLALYTRDAGMAPEELVSAPCDRARAVIRLILERHVERVQLARMRGVCRAILQSERLAVWTLGADGQLAICEGPSIGVPPAPCLSTAALHPDDAALLLDEAERVQTTGAEGSMEVRVRRGCDAPYRRYQAWVVPTPGDAGARAPAAFVVGVDVEEAREADALLRRLDRARDEVLAVLSHELRNPLAVMEAGLAVLRTPGVAPEVAERALTRMEEGLGDQARLVEGLLDLVRVETGQVDRAREPVELCELTWGVAERLAREARPLGVELAVTVPDVPCWTLGDAGRLDQVLQELTAGAVRYTQPGRCVRLTLQCAEGWAHWIVQDAGRGLTPEECVRVFDLFTQGRGDGRRTLEVGVRLSLVRAIVRQHGGRVWAESEGDEKGSAFHVEIPLTAPSQTRATPAPGPEAPATNTAGGHVFVVEDNEGFRELLAEVLRLHGWGVVQARTAQEARKRAHAASPPDALLLDLGLPDGDGRALLGELRALPGWGHVPACALTGWGESRDRASGQAAGFNLFMVKPPDLERLLAWLASLRGV